MYIRKKYGESKNNICPFCDNQSITKNQQGISVCKNHKNTELLDLKCICGEWLDLAFGKWGPYFICMKCGNISWNKGIELNPQIKNLSSNKKTNYKKYNLTSETTITTDDVDYF